MSTHMEYIDYKGRKVPTLTTLKKLGLAEADGEIVYIKNQITKATDNELAIPKEYLNAIVWNLQKYTSITCIERLLTLLSEFARGYDKYLSATDPSPTIIESLKCIYESIAGINEGLNLLKVGYKSGYSNIRNAYGFSDYFAGRLLWEYDYEPIGYRPGVIQSVGLFSWIEKAVYMAERALFFTLRAKWSVPLAFQERHCYNLQIAPKAKDYQRSSLTEHFKTGQVVPKSGIWNPFSFKSGSPNYLCAGNYFPESQIAVERIYRPDYFDEDDNYTESWEDFEYEKFPAQWELLWEDTRYADGIIPEEENEYLDQSSAFPSDPPEPPVV
ncbi:MAG: hypothetical protein JW915_21720 [Chitinispirillaceae bacterium]|nr:hypothetical protein [Chitinispirillaceae bacterium]